MATVGVKGLMHCHNSGFSYNDYIHARVIG